MKDFKKINAQIESLVSNTYQPKMNIINVQLMSKLQ